MTEFVVQGQHDVVARHIANILGAARFYLHRSTGNHDWQVIRLYRNNQCLVRVRDPQMATWLRLQLP